jgi:hypothetical protein
MYELESGDCVLFFPAFALGSRKPTKERGIANKAKALNTNEKSANKIQAFSSLCCTALAALSQEPRSHFALFCRVLQVKVLGP